ncbi:Aldo-ket-red domain-containing protein [Aphelenchoides besseyi]|nr:Aldo-ket-red domain-containing protein [Aphelenchoides besseyi]
MSDEYHVKLSNGLELPLIGYGSWQSTDEDQLKKCLSLALDIGYRYIDTATLYGNHYIIGQVLQEYYDAGKLKREDVFITTKLPLHGHRKEDVEHFIKEALKDLRTDYIDLYLIHNACPVKRNDDYTMKWIDNGRHLEPIEVPHIETWRELEHHYKAGTLKSIGVSNFTAKQLQELYDQAEVKPMNLQIELHIYHRRRDLVELCKKLNISITSYATLVDPNRKFPDRDLLHHPLVLEIAKKHNKTAAQVLLRHLIQLKISVIPKSLTPKRIEENFGVFDFSLTDEDISRLDNEITEDVRLFEYIMVENHPYYPPY